jgi:hypothetical protein
MFTVGWNKAQGDTPDQLDVSHHELVARFKAPRLGKFRPQTLGLHGIGLNLFNLLHSLTSRQHYYCLSARVL